EKDPRTYEHVPPESVGNRREIVVSDQAGRANILARSSRSSIVWTSGPFNPASPVGAASTRGHRRAHRFDRPRRG
ncbi:MAG: hypothetical protein EBZ85_05470, partial [Actinobacteria bacterium]|nr:hypothetical protein [Actinomycetota bacterium]